MSKSKRFCSVPQCNNYSSKDISLHYFPVNDKKLCMTWKIVLKIDKPISKFLNVCSEHFTKDDFTKVSATTESKHKRLKKGAMPSLKLPIGTHPKKRAHKRSQRLISHDASMEGMNVAKKNILEAGISADIAMQGGSQPIPCDDESENPAGMVIDDENMVTVLERGTQTDLTNLTLADTLNNDEKMKHFTSIDIETLTILIECCENVLSVNNESVPDLKLTLVLVLVKLKLDIPFTCLSVLFSLAVSTCKRYFYIGLPLLAKTLKPTIYWPTKEEILANMPKCFKGFGNTRIVLDCTEIAVTKCKCLDCRIRSYSHYKGRHTIKFLIGIAPSGLITYLSNAYGGRSSDKYIFNAEAIIDKLDPNDAVMVDKGFIIEKECEERLIKLIRPPFLKQQKQFSKTDALKTAAIAKARVHVERAIQRIKTYTMLNKQIPQYFLPYIDDIMTVVVGLVNLSSPILADDKF